MKCAGCKKDSTTLPILDREGDAYTVLPDFTKDELMRGLCATFTGITVSCFACTQCHLVSFKMEMK